MNEKNCSFWGEIIYSASEKTHFAKVNLSTNRQQCILWARCKCTLHLFVSVSHCPLNEYSIAHVASPRPPTPLFSLTLSLSNQYAKRITIVEQIAKAK